MVIVKQLQPFYKKLKQLILSTLLVIVSTGCAHIEDVPVEVAEIQPDLEIPVHPSFGKRANIREAQSIFQLTPAQEHDFLAFLTTQKAQGISEHDIVANYIKKFVNGFNYHSQTLVASESISQKQGNCLSLAIVTTALARLAGVKVDYQLMDMRPIYLKKGNTVFTSQHVRSILYDPNWVKEDNMILFIPPRLIIDYFPSTGTGVKKLVTESEFISMYFRNKAADAISRNDVNEAYWLSVESLKFAKNHPHAVNMLALLFEQQNQADEADRLFNYGIDNTEEKLELLGNYKNFLIKHQRFHEARLVSEQIKEFNQPNPFDWLSIADKELTRGNLIEAKRFYEKVIGLAPYLHHGYAGIAKVEYLRGNLSRARMAFEKATDLSVNQGTTSLLRAKLMALKETAESE